MGFKDFTSNIGRTTTEERQEAKDVEAQRVALLPPPQYHMEVNKGSMNMRSQTQRLNTLWNEGWRLHTALEQDGNTVFVLERRS